jgi:hypothetical protein
MLRITIGVLCVIASIEQTQRAAAAPPRMWLSAEKAQKLEFKQDRARLDAIDPANKDDLKLAASEIERKWAHHDADLYAALMVTACQQLSKGLPDPNTYAVVRGYAVSALDRSNAIPISLVHQLTGILLNDSAWISKQDWQSNRKEDALHCLSLLHEVRATVIKEYDFNDVPMLNVGLPPGARVNFVSGMDPNDIEDPQVRSQYSAAVEKNNRHIEEFSTQRELHDLDKQFGRQIVQFLIVAYSSPPYDLKELQASLKGSALTGDERKQVLDAVKARIPSASASKPAATEASPKKR